jgi:hypothetical protein
MLMRQLTFICFLLGSSTTVLAQELFVYPKNDQNAEQQQKDHSECYVWAKGQTGFDPQNPPRVQTASVDNSPDGSVVRGAARGALLGEIIDDDAGKGAAAGAAVGVMRRRDRKRNEQQQQDAYEQQQAAQLAEMQNNYNRAFKGCMEARDYSIS